MIGYAIYICGDVIGAPGGAGQVTRHELNVLQRMYGPDNVRVFQFKDGRPDPYDQLDIPYLSDYFILSKVAALYERNGPPAHVHIYSGCYTETIRYLQTRLRPWHEPTFVSVTCPAHDRNLSMQARGAAYFLPHIDIPELWQQHVHGLRLADLVIAPGETPRAFLESEGVAHDKLVIIPHGIERFPETVAPFPERFTVGYLGGLGPDKGLVYLMKAWGKLNLPDATLMIAGAGSSQLEKFVRQYVPEGRVRLMGYVPDAYDFYNQLSVYVQPSVSEGFGIEVAEAMSCGRPVIVSTGAGAASLLDPMPGGAPSAQLVPPANVIELMANLAAMYNGRGALEGLGLLNREIAQRLTWDKMEAQYEAVFYNRMGV
jgi:glycosyltransferase involved in cell wall biosynthesis